MIIKTNKAVGAIIPLSITKIPRYTETAAAEILGMHVQTLRRLRYSGGIAYKRQDVAEPIVLHPWPALMRPDTLRAYLDCRSDSDFSRKMRTLKKRGYPGPDQETNRHVKDVVDRYLIPQADEAEQQKQRMLEDARGAASW